MLGLCLAMPLLAACGSGGSSSFPGPTVGPFAAVTVGTANNLGTVQVFEKGTINVNLPSVHWTIKTPSGGILSSSLPTAHLAQIGKCRTGQDCSATVGVFHAVKTGTVQLVATRKLCGPVNTCPPDKRTWKVNVVVVTH